MTHKQQNCVPNKEQNKNKFPGILAVLQRNRLAHMHVAEDVGRSVSLP
jgi:hypothetical protein